jgi:hypothetical protein
MRSEDATTFSQVSSLVFLLSAEFTRWLILTDPERRAGAAAREEASSTAS